MKNIILVAFVFLSSLNSFADDVAPCSAFVNSEEVKLELSPTGHYLIAVEDSHFDEYDVMIDTTNPKMIKARLAKFVATDLVPKLKKEISVLSQEMQNEILKLAKARFVDASIGYDADGYANLTLNQGDDRLDLYCSK